MKMLIDCDPGVDDAFAILFALYRTDVDVVGISTAAGNVSAADGARNALRLLKLAGFEGKIPVCAGAEKPLYGECEPYPTFMHGENGFGNVDLPDSSVAPLNKDVSDFLYQIACDHSGDVVLLSLGRMTNLAHTLIKYPDFVRKIKRVVAMGGAVFAPGNVSPVSEANIAGDPEAADLVFQADWDITLVGLDVTCITHLTRTDVNTLLEKCHPGKRAAVQFLSDALIHYMNGSLSQNDTMGYSPLHDPLAMVTAVDPSVVTTRRMITRVECGGTYCRGKIVVDLREQPIEGRYVNHCLSVDSQRALNELFAAFRKETKNETEKK